MEEAKSFRQHTVTKQQIAELIRAARQRFESEKVEKWADECRALQVKLAADRFNLVVLGQFKRGKSSLINAIIGKELLPTGLLPLTSAITTLCYGPKEKVCLQRKGWVFDQEIPIKDLPEFVTQQGNPGNEKGLIEARIELPVAFLRRGVHFVDTPGIGSSQLENTATTNQFLPEADAVIFVTSVEAPLSQVEQNFLREVSGYVHKLFIVVNKIDLISPPERVQVLDYMRENVEIILGPNEISIFPVSARQALTAQTIQEKYENGIKQLEAALEVFLVNEKNQTFCVSILERLIQILASAFSGENEANLKSGQLDSLWIAATNLRNTLFDNEPLLSNALTNKTTAIPVPKNRKIVNVDSRLKKKHDLPKARTCPICAALGQELFDYFVDLQQVGGNEQDEFLASGGLCQVHAWQFREMAAAVTINQMYAPLVESAAAELKQMHSDHRNGKESNNQALPKKNTCPACALIDKAERAQVKTFLEYVKTSNGKSYYKDALGLCLPHLEAVLHANLENDIQNFLLEEQARHLEELSEDMRNYVLKREALRRDLLNTNEENAWIRVIVQMVGERMSYILSRNEASPIWKTQE